MDYLTDEPTKSGGYSNQFLKKGHLNLNNSIYRVQLTIKQVLGKPE